MAKAKKIKKSAAPAEPKKKRESTPSFVLELPLVVHGAEVRQLASIFEAGKRRANVMIQHGRDLMIALRSDPGWTAARAMPKATARQRAARGAAFQAVRARHQFSEYAFHVVVKDHRNAAPGSPTG